MVKNVYEKPLMRVEMFVANNNVAASSCTVVGGISYTFDCMVGPNVDAENVINDTIASGCSSKIGYADGLDTARDYSSRGSRHSDNNPTRANWSKGNGYLQVTYSGAEGILYTDGSTQTDSQVWSVEDSYVKHNGNSGGMHHMVAPVVDASTVSSSW